MCQITAPYQALGAPASGGRKTRSVVAKESPGERGQQGSRASGTAQDHLVNRPRSGDGLEATKGWSRASTEEVSERAA